MPIRRFRRFRPIAMTALFLVGFLTTISPTIAGAVAKNDFAVAAPKSITLAPGKSKTARISVKRGSGFKAPVTFTATSSLTGVAVNIGSVTAKSAVLTLRADTTVAAQNGEVVISVAGGGVTRTATVSVAVSGAAGAVAAPAPAATVAAATPTSTAAAPPTAPPSTAAAPVVTSGPGRKMDVMLLQDDGKDAAGNYQYKYTMAIAKGDGTFDIKPTNLSKLPSIARSYLTDLNADGLADVVMVTFDAAGKSGLSVALNRGSGNFDLKQSNVTVPSEWQNFTVGDFDGDGRGDLIIAQKSGQDASRIIVGISKGDGTFDIKTTNSKTLGDAFFLRFADVNGDGRGEIVSFDMIKGTANGRISVGVISQFDITFTEAHVGPFPISESLILAIYTSASFDVGDVDGDGQAEAMAVLPTGQGGNTFLVGKYNKSTKKFVWGPTNLSEVNAGPILLLGDYTGDGRADILTNNDVKKLEGTSVGISNGTSFDLKPTNAPVSNGKPSIPAFNAADLG